MERLWAPWRMQYIAVEQPQGCIFCTKAAEVDDKKNLILKRGELALIMLNAFPYNNGHLMVAPYRHVGDIMEVTHDEMCEIMALTADCCRVLREAFNPHGFNIGMNLGTVAGAGIADHVHMHIVPRWNGDTNFMLVVGDCKVLPDALEATYEKLMAAKERIERG